MRAGETAKCRNSKGKGICLNLHRQLARESGKKVVPRKFPSFTDKGGFFYGATGKLENKEKRRIIDGKKSCQNV